MKFIKKILAETPLSFLLLMIPIAMICEARETTAAWRFLSSGLAVIPLAGLLGSATEDLTETMGPGLGGFLNGSLGNAAELIIGLVAIREGPVMYPLVKASITGSIVGNVLFVLGMSFVAGGIRHPRQTFNRTAASTGATLLALAAVSLVIPAAYYTIASGAPGRAARVVHVSEEISVILLIVYALNLLFLLHTHKSIFNQTAAHEKTEASGTVSSRRDEKSEASGKVSSRRDALIMLALATAGIAYVSEIFVGSAQDAAASFGMNPVFIGVFVVAVVGNAAEHSSSVLMAIKNKLDVSLMITVGSSIQIALFVAPVLLFSSLFINPSHPLDLHFTLLEVLSVVISMLILAFVCQDGESNWLEGVMMLGVYIILAVAFYNLP